MLVSVLFIDKADTFRAPIAKFVLKNMVKEKNLNPYFFIDTASVNDKYEGKDLTSEAKEQLELNQIPFYVHESKRIKKSDYEKYDYILTMEDRQIKELINVFGGDPNNKIQKIMDFAYDSHDIDYPKNGDFSECFQEIQTGCQSFLDNILED